MIILNSGLLVGLGLLHLADPVEFPLGVIALEIIVTLILLVEVLCRLCSQGRAQFFSSWCNVLDIAVVVLCVSSSILFFTLHDDLEEAVAAVLMVCRYGVHFVRVLMLLKLTRKQQSLRGGRRRRSMDVTFTKLNQSAGNGEDFEDFEEEGGFGVIEMVAIGGGFDDFDGYSERVNSVLGESGGSGGSGGSKHVSQFDQLCAKHIRSPNKKSVAMEKESVDEESMPVVPYKDADDSL